jgi:UDP-N-acetylmuramate dehydrogenase
VSELAVALRAALGERLLANEPLARYTSFRLGGPAEWFVRANAVSELISYASLAARLDVPLTIIGGGSNILVSDAGIRGLVVLNKSRDYTLQPAPEGQGFTLTAASGLSLPWLAGQLAKVGASGLEWTVGIPGTIGGAVLQNAGAWGSETRERLLWVEWLTPQQAIEHHPAIDLGLRYRHSILKDLPRAERPVILQAAFRLDTEDPAAIQARLATYTARRTASQPRAASGGSTFTNPPGDYAGRLIEAAGLKGRRIGEAEISQQHANFIVTAPGTCASDVYGLIALAQSEVERQFGIQLHPEIEMLGEWGLLNAQ